MEPLRTPINNPAINSKYDYILNSSRVLTIPCIRCDDPVFNKVIKQETIDETDSTNDNQLFHIGDLQHTIRLNSSSGPNMVQNQLMVKFALFLLELLNKYQTRF
ncbi:uncharacterized protein LOC115033646 [Acyrthosiphon pisum]|uniref:Uncharacterized protein n=1 Tax=Acyrthosiphon pisum TaxID=7029 RepID=A0A8R2NLP2_ACYPI|nr:uncharacterized protein LOC115033646 [Acyrthosiphon pisum]XP_029342477.1 uncharacterized protein LOC115033646 [Acyrthosiphon pisum]XP_029342478.1 uncharacterized protein LOC115033646 [Acyrthosiphon pisum]XP_029342479.1 uncharacterized protein LOC115033646 [Acyrthosiphon pisum]XP_029342480.1 uncharacterized protein LOC115033646 [Acyrthosiphon pisum]XP_029342481.1 uncharacterized protein LOC115033646 [Acyrthosiphon pisum]XP_029342482.1 uncharacterized protein LOC115033646 [Acyrthosiphon pisu